MSAPLDDLYLVWLYSQFGNVTTKSTRRSYWNLSRKLYTTEFVWFIPNDDARVEDGRDLRFEFIEDAEIPFTNEVDAWVHLGCSYLELLIALSRRLAFETDGKAEDWFWHVIENIGLHEYNDAYKEDFSGFVDEVTERITWRTYNADGHGGLFPLRRAETDQKKVELWYQMSAYVLENT